MSKALFRNSSDYIYYGLSFIAIVSIIISALTYSILPMAIPLLLIGGMLLLVDVKLVYFLLIGFLSISTEIQVSGNLSTDLPGEPIMWIMTACYFLLLIAHPKNVWVPLRNPITIVLLLHLIWISFTVITAERSGVAVKFLLAKIWYVVPFYFMVFMYLIDQKSIRVCLQILFTLIGFSVFFVMVKHAILGFTFDTIEAAVQPIFRNHVNYACLLVIVLPFVWVAYFWKNKNSFENTIVIGLNILLPIAIYLSYTRAAIGSIIIGIIAYFIIKWKLTKTAFITAGVVVLFGLIYMVQSNNFMDFAPSYKDTVTHREFGSKLEATAKGEDLSTMERIYRWVAGVKMVAEKPITGYGPNNFFPTYKKYTLNSFKTYVSDNPERSGIHNYYLMIAVEQGVPGLLIFLGFCIVTLLYGEKYYHRIEDPFYKNIVAASYMSFVIILSILLVNDLLEADKVGPFFFLSAAFMALSSYWERFSKTENITKQVS